MGLNIYVHRKHSALVYARPNKHTVLFYIVLFHGEPVELIEYREAGTAKLSPGALIALPTDRHTDGPE